MLANNQVADAFDRARSAFEIASAIRYYRELTRSELVMGICLIESGKFQNAAVALSNATRRCEESRLIEIEPLLLRAWAKWHLRQERLEGAADFASRALVVAERSLYTFEAAESHLLLSEYWLRRGALKEASNHAEEAMRLATGIDSRYRFVGVCDEARRILLQIRS